MYFTARRLSQARTLGRIGDTPTTATLHTISDGPESVAQTCRIMRKAAIDAITDPNQAIRLLVMSIKADNGIADRDWPRFLSALHSWVKENIEYTEDPDGIELVQTPQKTVEFGQGDCDDHATLLASMIKTAGYPARFCAVGMGGNPIEHVLTQAPMGPDWISCETILDVPLGWEPPDITKRYLLNI